ncbi:LysR family transcriptional regulator [Nissabacter sp. SGAir0207]|uniref:LysR family transcriptional regulator n=1 Tax=Nissabacter sp. SGAir0207 TaxID=2126321 RepID=UPI0010CD5EC3|nr:LysR family transcriptional regulator [Nissabacter sp. SGAir0207]QCR37980.1 LysR family transcriptional regulator [Nissabacter sp. SGAir0207]
MTLQQLHYFLAAIEHGTLSRAAEQLHIAQPSLSEQILRLEGEMGTHLFIRTNRKLILTEAGRRLLPYARATLMEAQRGFEAVQSVRELRGGVASFGTFGTAHQYFLAGLIAEFRRRYPEMRLRLVGLNSSEVAEAVINGDIEAGLVMLPVNNKSLVVSEPVWSAQVGYISADPARLAGRKDIHALLAAPLILSEAKWHNTDPIRTLLNRRAQQVRGNFEPVIEVEHQSTAFELAAQGLGDLIATRPILHHLGYHDRLGWVPVDPPIFEVFSFIYRADTAISSATRELMQLMRQSLNLVQARYRHIEN